MNSTFKPWPEAAQERIAKLKMQIAGMEDVLADLKEKLFCEEEHLAAGFQAHAQSQMDADNLFDEIINNLFDEICK